jgi:hypothetical protein
MNLFSASEGFLAAPVKSFRKLQRLRLISPTVSNKARISRSPVSRFSLMIGRKVYGAMFQLGPKSGMHGP